MKAQGLYDPFFEHDSCGVGFVADIKGAASHQIVEEGITVLRNLEHRGAIGGDLKTGDGAGMLTQIPHEFFKKICEKSGISLPGPGMYGAGMFFMPVDKSALKRAKSFTEEVIASKKAELLG
ncbi:MAG TPA: hypothetical protein DCO75_08005, partial [Fibrobacteres bacterium]|nr:hypothetical protein [Fibrobacterota bacterium]